MGVIIKLFCFACSLQKAGGLNRFQQIVDCVHVKTFNSIFTESGRKDHHLIMSMLFVKINPVDVRHLNVEEQKIHGEFSEEFRCLCCIGECFFELKKGHLAAKRLYDVQCERLIIYGDTADHERSSCKVTENSFSVPSTSSWCLPG